MIQHTVKTRVGTVHRNVVLLVCFFSYLLYAIDRSLMPPVFSFIMDDLGLRYAQQGALFSGFFIGFIVFPFVSGSLSDRYGRVRMLLIGTSIFAIGTYLTGTAQNFNICMVWRVLTGIGEGMFWAPLIALVSSLFSDARGRTIGIIQAAYPLGFFVGTILAGSMAEATGSWRLPFYISGVLSMLAVVGIFLLVAEPQKGETEVVSEKLSPWSVFRERNVIIAAIILFVAFWGVWAFSAWIPTFFSEERGFSITMASVITGVFGLVGMVGYIVCGALSDKIGRKTMLVIASISGAIMSFLVLQLTSLPLLFIAIAIGGILGGAIVPVTLALATDSVPPVLAGAATGIVINVGTISGIISPPLAGQLAGTSSIHNALIWHWSLPLLLVGLLALLLRPQPSSDVQIETN